MYCVLLQCHSRLFLQLPSDQELCAGDGGAQASPKAEQVQEVADDASQQYQ